jgi:hypothetical protein|tara:strand:- start:1168 stop:1356 length:189 start_codon:yes stop_codon:yes gene_type:complete
MDFARTLITVMFLALFAILVYFIFTQEVTGTTRDLLFIIIGGFLSSFQNVIDYWFKKDKKDE